MFSFLFSDPGLSLARLHSFLLVVEAGSIAKAAGHELSRQNLFSRQIKELENFFGTDLTERTGKEISITPEGERLAAILREQFTALEDFRKDNQDEPKRIRLGAGASILDWLVVPSLPSLAKLLPGCRLSLESLRSKAIAGKIRDRSLDFGVVRKDALKSGQDYLPIGKLGYSLVASNTVLKRTGVEKLDRTNANRSLERLPLAVLGGDGRFRSRFDESCAAKNVRPRIIVECSSFLHVRNLVESRMAAGILPDAGLHGLDPARFTSVELPLLKSYKRELVFAWNKRLLALRDLREDTPEKIAAVLAKVLCP